MKQIKSFKNLVIIFAIVLASVMAITSTAQTLNAYKRQHRKGSQ